MESPLPSPLAWEGEHLTVDGVRCADVAAAEGTPCFAFSEARLQSGLAAIAAGLEPAGGGVVRYCAKTNHELAILEQVAAAGCEVLVCHAGELELALAAGFQPERIAYQRPWAPAAEMTAVVAAGVRLVHAFRREDFDRWEAAAAAAGRRLQVSLRLRGEGRVLSPFAALHARHGLPPAAAAAAARRCAASRWLELTGLSRYLGTQQSSPARLEVALGSLVALAARLRRETGVEIREIDVGGGLPSPAIRRLRPGNLWRRARDVWKDPPTSTAGFTAALARAFSRAVERQGLEPRPRLVVEPGRAVAGAAGILLTRVVAVEGRWVTCDASRAVLAESPLLLSRRILPARRRPGRSERFIHLSGSTLNTMDVLDLWRRLPAPEVGDLLALADAGAYSLSRASRYGALGPPAFLVRNGGFERIRRAEETADLIAPMAGGRSPGLGRAGEIGGRR